MCRLALSFLKLTLLLLWRRLAGDRLEAEPVQFSALSLRDGVASANMAIDETKASFASTLSEALLEIRNEVSISFILRLKLHACPLHAMSRGAEVQNNFIARRGGDTSDDYLPAASKPPAPLHSLSPLPAPPPLLFPLHVDTVALTGDKRLGRG